MQYAQRHIILQGGNREYPTAHCESIQPEYSCAMKSHFWKLENQSSGTQ